jgi:lincosamide nucleotidyltransferase A/C/D/E
MGEPGSEAARPRSRGSADPGASGACCSTCSGRDLDCDPARFRAVARRQDLHPCSSTKTAPRARQAAIDGGFHVFPRSSFVTGSLAGVPVPCVSIDAQRLFHTGYELRGIDLQDLAVLDELNRGGK